MFGSLRTRLAVGGILVAIIAVVVTAIAVQQVTKRDIRSSIQRDLDTELFIRDELAFFGLDQPGWADVESVVRELALVTGERIAVANLTGDILADSEPLIFGADASLPSQATIVDPQSSLIDFGFAEEIAEDLEIQNQIVEACLKVQDLAYARFSDESGLELVLPATSLDDAEATAFIDCLVDAGIDDPDFSPTPACSSPMRKGSRSAGMGSTPMFSALSFSTPSSSTSSPSSCSSATAMIATPGWSHRCGRGCSGSRSRSLLHWPLPRQFSWHGG